MSWSYALAVAIGGAIGAPLRLFIDSRVTRVADSRGASNFPWGLLVVNAIGSLLIGVAFATVDGSLRALLATGACGALTTYSAYALFVQHTWARSRAAAWQAIIVMPIVCVGACAVGVFAARTVVG